MTATKSRFATVLIHDPGGKLPLVGQVHGPPDAQRDRAFAEYAAWAYRADPVFAHIARFPEGRHYDSQTTGPVDDRFRAFARRMLDAFGVCTSQAAYASARDGQVLVVKLYREPEAPTPEAPAMALLAQSFDHFRAAYDLARLPPSLGDQHLPVWLLGRGGRILAATAASEAVLAAGDLLSVNDNRLVPTAQSHRARWEQTLLHAAGGDAEPKPVALTLMRGTAGLPAFVSFQPFRTTVSGGVPIPGDVLVRLIDPQVPRRTPNDESWKMLFKLTATDARLAAALLAGDCTLPDAARRCALNYQTARVHLARIFQKTATHNQAELVRLLASTEAFGLT